MLAKHNTIRPVSTQAHVLTHCSLILDSGKILIMRVSMTQQRMGFQHLYEIWHGASL